MVPVKGSRLVAGHAPPPRADVPVLSLVKLLGPLGSGTDCVHCGTVLSQRYGGAEWSWINLDVEACCATVGRALNLPVRSCDDGRGKERT